MPVQHPPPALKPFSGILTRFPPARPGHRPPGTLPLPQRSQRCRPASGPAWAPDTPACRSTPSTAPHADNQRRRAGHLPPTHRPRRPGPPDLAPDPEEHRRLPRRTAQTGPFSFWPSSPPPGPPPPGQQPLDLAHRSGNLSPQPFLRPHLGQNPEVHALCLFQV